MTLCDVCAAGGYPYDAETCKNCEYNPNEDGRIEMETNLIRYYLKELRTKESDTE